MKDDDGNVINDGDVITFAYGIPPVKVIAPIIKIDGVLIAITEGHNPPRIKLSSIKKYYNIYKEVK